MKYIPLTQENIDELKKQLEPTMQDKFLKLCLEALDTDVSPDDLVNDEFGCAESLSTLIKRICPDFPVIFSTKDLDWKLFIDKRFKRVDVPERGCVVISPRTNSVYGHCGVFITNERIASNNSKNGLFQGNYSWDDWIKEFKTKRGLRIYIYKLLDN